MTVSAAMSVQKICNSPTVSAILIGIVRAFCACKDKCKHKLIPRDAKHKNRYRNNAQACPGEEAPNEVPASLCIRLFVPIPPVLPERYQYMISTSKLKKEC